MDRIRTTHPHRRTIRDHFDGPIRPVRIAPAYRLVVVTGFTMLLLPAACLAVIAALAFGAYDHASHHAAILGAWRSVLLSGLIYFGPLLAGAIAAVMR